jgi:glycosyltransferase involved in cell wall biosynthesis
VKLSICLATRNGSTRNPSGTFATLLARFKELADELVIIVDDTSTDDTFEIAKKFTKHVSLFVHDPLFIEMRRQTFYRCTGDWIFAVDDDDILNSHWTRPMVERLMSARSVTHYWLPARFLVTPERYLSTAPYIGHSMAMFYRNIESLVVLPEKLHQQLAIAGEPAYVAGLYVNAMDFAWHDRAMREAKISRYDEAYDDHGTGFDQTRFYLYEDYYFETRELVDLPDLKIMSPIAGNGVKAGIHVRIVDCPQTFTAAQTYWVTARIVNNSARALLPQSEFIRWGELTVTYRWFSGDNMNLTEERIVTPFPARILPHHEHDVLVRVKAPAAPGGYRLQIDIREEHKRWLSDAEDAGDFEARDIQVAPLVWPPRSPEAR